MFCLPNSIPSELSSRVKSIFQHVVGGTSCITGRRHGLVAQCSSCPVNRNDALLTMGPVVVVSAAAAAAVAAGAKYAGRYESRRGADDRR